MITKILKYINNKYLELSIEYRAEKQDGTTTGSQERAACLWEKMSLVSAIGQEIEIIAGLRKPEKQDTIIDSSKERT